MHDWDGGGWGWGAWVFMALVMVVFWGGLIAALVTVLRHRSPETGFTSPPGDALHILEERFARGEIDIDDFQQRRAMLRER
jgi:putative membrane protein